jgi:hypothetical protein
MTTPPTPHVLLNFFFFKYYKMVALLLFGMLLLLLVIVIIVVLLLKKPKNDVVKKREEERASLFLDLKTKIYQSADDVGITQEDLDTEIEEQQNESPLACYVTPENGECNQDFYDLINGCCQLRDESKSSQEQTNDMIREIVTEIGVLFLTEYIITSVLPRFGKALAAYSSKALAKLSVKLGRRLAQKLALRLAAFVSKVLIKLGSGPVGWALLIFESISMMLEMADLRNYESYIDNSEIMKARDLFIYKLHEAMVTTGEDYPIIFPFSILFPDVSLSVVKEVLEIMMYQYGDLLATVDGIQDAFDLEFEYMDNDLEPTPEMEAEGDRIFGDFITLIREDDAVYLDKYIFDGLQAALPLENKNDVILIPSMSTVNSFGIGISESAAERWNNENKEAWFQYLDPFLPVRAPTEDWSPPLTAAYTDTYLIPNSLNPGSIDSPNLITKTLPMKVTLAYPFGPMVSMCERTRTSAQYKDPISPLDHGVTFNFKTGVCNYTRDYCDRYVIDYKTKTWKDGTPYTECELSDAQKTAEDFLGTTVVRDAKRYYADPGEIIKDLDTLYNDREDKHGKAGALALTIVDPLGFTEAATGFVQNIEEKMAGKTKFCRTGNTCKFFQARHNGGNFMTWTAKGPDGDIYPHPLLGVQGQVKVGEDHTFFVPEGGSFRIKCDPGDGEDFPYDELPQDGSTKGFTCWNGKVNKPYTVGDTVESTVELATDYGVNVGNECTNGFAECTMAIFGGKNSPFVNGGISPINWIVGATGADTSGGNTGSWGGGNNSTFAYSDRRLKKDVKKTKLKSPISGLDVYTWKWNEIAMSTYGLNGGDFGFITDEIDDQYVAKDVYEYEYILENTPVHKALLKLKSKYLVK